ncbi:STAS domain-containing protein [Mongoliimonas terrestris]|uniref:STAS domain-containing protein n=1 Tax=Mongoliimonas terrestris TaxID=1709001 RepID=UPI000949664D|nr:STAS domain-containing protein [Mongoliimonas terrestris]
MASPDQARFAALLAADRDRILAAWIGALKAAGTVGQGRITAMEMETQAREMLGHLVAAIGEAGFDAKAPAYGRLRDGLAEISRTRAMQGFSPSETAAFVFSLKRPLHEAIARAEGLDPAAAAEIGVEASVLVDQFGLLTVEAYQKRREEVIIRQQREIAELSTPVVKLWDGVLALPLIGTLDSERTQVVMENLLQSIVDHSAEIAIIDITGVPTVDTLVAQHLLKTVAAARLMGADCIISGIRPQIAQTMVHLGVELNVVSKATLADAFAVALRRIGRTVVPARPAASAQG